MEEKVVASLTACLETSLMGVNVKGSSREFLVNASPRECLGAQGCDNGKRRVIEDSEPLSSANKPARSEKTLTDNARADSSSYHAEKNVTKVVS